MNKWKWIIVLAGLSAIVAFSNQLFFNEKEKPQRINGFNLVAPTQKFPIDSLKNVKNTGADWVSVVPYAFCNAETAEVTFDHDRQWWGEKPDGIIETIQMAQSIGLKVMLKPHLWVGGQGWAGDLKFDSDSLWTVFEVQYSKYINRYAKIADSLDIEIYCIGTEIRNSTKERGRFWRELISETRVYFDGQLTYAANWDEYDKITFWNELDYIGIDAYFPLSDQRNPEKELLISAWERPKNEMQKLSERFQKPIIFTEFGYESIEYNTMGHWKLFKDTLSVDFGNQKIAFEALFASLRSEEWWSGGFIWKWHLNRHGLNRRNIKAYTPQDKPALGVIKDEFKHNF